MRVQSLRRFSPTGDLMAIVGVSQAAHSAQTWGLRATETGGAKVILAKPAYEVLLERTVERSDGLRIAVPIQVAVDPMTGPGGALRDPH